MKHLFQINMEFVKKAGRKWDDLTYDEQKGYLSRHPKSKRKITVRPESKSVQKSDSKSGVKQEIMNVCEPLITDLQDKAVAQANRIIKNFEKKKKAAPEDMSWQKFRQEYTKDPYVMQILMNVYTPKERYGFTVGNFKLDEERQKKYYEGMKDAIRVNTTSKLSRALGKYIGPEFVEVDNIDLSHGSQGFEITADLKDDQGRSWNFRTRAIGAGGYNIQEWHYRYLIHLSSPEVPKEVVRRKITEREKAEKEEKRQQRVDARAEKQKLKDSKKIAGVFAEIKRRVKDWDEWERSSLVQQERYDELERRRPNVERLREFINRYNMKRKELMQKISDGEITFDVFDEVDDIMLGDRYFYDYNALKKVLPNAR